MKKVLVYFTNLWYSIFRIRDNEGVRTMRKYKAIDFAYWFIWFNKVKQIENEITDTDKYDVYEGLTHLKVQKLLYFADGIHLAVNGEPLFNEKIYAWQHGPVIKEVYSLLKNNENREIEFDDKNYDVIEEINNNKKLYETLVTTYESYAGYTAWQLREKTHVVGSPWQKTVDQKGMNKEIDRKTIKNYFKQNIVSVE